MSDNRWCHLTKAYEFMRLAPLGGQLNLPQKLHLDALMIDPLGCERGYPYLRHGIVENVHVTKTVHAWGGDRMLVTSPIRSSLLLLSGSTSVSFPLVFTTADFL